jgi:hypothetical protein
MSPAAMAAALGGDASSSMGAQSYAQTVDWQLLKDAASSGGCHLIRLPLPLILRVLSFLEPRELALVQATCKTMSPVACDNTLWYALAEAHACAKCCRSFRWAHTLNIDACDPQAMPVAPENFYKVFYKEKYARGINMSDQPLSMGRTMHKRCIFCSGRRREADHPEIPGVGQEPLEPGLPETPAYVRRTPNRGPA